MHLFSLSWFLYHWRKKIYNFFVILRWILETVCWPSVFECAKPAFLERVESGVECVCMGLLWWFRKRWEVSGVEGAGGGVRKGTFLPQSAPDVLGGAGCLQTLQTHTIKTDHHIYARPQNRQAQRFELKICISRSIWIIADNSFPKIPEICFWCGQHLKISSVASVTEMFSSFSAFLKDQKQM